MLRNYFTVAVRNLLGHKVYSAINISGLAIGTACVILIGLYVHSEVSFDSQHSKADRIYRVMRKTLSAGASPTYSERTNGGLAVALKEEFPEVEQTVRVHNEWVLIWIRRGERVFSQKLCVADAHFLEVFDFSLAPGTSRAALEQPYSIMLTQQMARKYFGYQDPMGQTLRVEDRRFEADYTVVGVLDDIPESSSLRFDFLIAPPSRSEPEVRWTEWAHKVSWRPLVVYVLLRDQADVERLQQQLPGFTVRHIGEEDARYISYDLQPLKRIYLHSDRDYPNRLEDPSFVYGDINQVRILSAAAVFILLIACINFMNLATARSARRAMEVGIRKASGANRGQLIGQFLGESLLFSFLALLIALVAAQLCLPALNGVTGKQLVLFGAPGIVVLLLGAGGALAVGVLAGSYPAFFLSSFHPADVLKGTRAQRTEMVWVRKGMVIFQFAASVGLISGTTVVFDQLQYVRDKDLGFDKSSVLQLPIYWRSSALHIPGKRRLSEDYSRVKAAFLDHPGVEAVAASRFEVGTYASLGTFIAEGSTAEWPMRVHGIDEDFLPFFGITLVAGRNFPRSYVEREWNADVEPMYILNETAVRRLGWDEPVGKTFGGKGWRPGRVIGVVKDFHVRTLRDEIEPVVLTARRGSLKYVYARIAPQDREGTMRHLAATWQRFLPERPFEFAALESQIDQECYLSEIKLSRVFATFAVLAITVACLGLFGLATLMAERRRREIGTRKALGATVSQIVGLVSKDFVQLVILANLIAWPVAYFWMRQWLHDFAYRIDLSIWPFLGGSVAALLIAAGTISYQSLRAANTDPVKALRQA